MCKLVVINRIEYKLFINIIELQLNAAKEALSNETKYQFAEFQKKFRIVEEDIKKMNAEIIKVSRHY